MVILMAEWRLEAKQQIGNVSWNQGIYYVNWLNKVLGKELEQGMVFRLPTEAEWERAARGDFGREWPWGNESLDQLIERELLSAPNGSSALPDEDDFLASAEVSDFFAKLFKFEHGE